MKKISRFSTTERLAKHLFVPLLSKYHEKWQAQLMNLTSKICLLTFSSMLHFPGFSYNRLLEFAGNCGFGHTRAETEEFCVSTLKLQWRSPSSIAGAWSSSSPGKSCASPKEIHSSSSRQARGSGLKHKQQQKAAQKTEESPSVLPV